MVFHPWYCHAIRGHHSFFGMLNGQEAENLGQNMNLPGRDLGSPKRQFFLPFHFLPFIWFRPVACQAAPGLAPFSIHVYIIYAASSKNEESLEKQGEFQRPAEGTLPRDGYARRQERKRRQRERENARKRGSAR